MEAASGNHRVGSDAIGIPVRRVLVREERIAGGRLNLVVPGISDGLSFGGVATALRLHEALARSFRCVRLIVTHEAESSFKFDRWPQWALDHGDVGARTIFFVLSANKPLSITADDWFVATFWSTAYYVEQLLVLQREIYCMANRLFVYLIQDYEPGFYAWSDRFALAQSTYTSGNAIAVFNSGFLAEYFERTEFRFIQHYVFEPKLNPSLREALAREHPSSKDKLILAYGRPSIARNAFKLVVEGLRAWRERFPRASEWAVVSAGEPHSSIDLGEGLALTSVGKLTLSEYATYINRCHVGLSFMFSPHPSYPPLEMAHCGAWVISNRFENKDLAKLSHSFINVREPTPDAVAESLVWACDQPPPAHPDWEWQSAFGRETEEFPFVDRLLNSWRS